MIKNYLLIAWRNLRKNKTFSIINITGLSIGVSCFLLIALYVLDELSYDKYNVHAHQIYRIDDQIKFGDFSYDGAETPPIMGPAFMKDYPQIVQYVRFKKHDSFVVQNGSENFKEDKAAYADPSIFDVFTLPMIGGDPNTALKEPYSLVITESTAQKYFNTTDVVGRTLVINKNEDYKITGVIKDIPEQSHFHFDFLFSMAEMDQSKENTWFSTNFQTYLLVKPGTDVEQLERRLNKTFMTYAAPQFQNHINMSEEVFEKRGNSMHISLMPLTQIHLYSNKKDELGTNSSIEYMYIFSAIAVFILLIACVNFMNLSTAHSSNRAKEVGLRKVFGSLRNNLIVQFFAESVFISLLSFLLAIETVLLLLPLFNHLTDKHISSLLLLNPMMLFGVLLLMIIVGLIAGSYPAFFLSSFKPIEVLKGNLSRGFKGSAVRNALVVFQFSISIILMIGTLVIFNQLNYIRSKNLGFNKDHVLVLQNTYALDTKVFRHEILQIRGVKSAAVTGFLPLSGKRDEQGFVTSPAFDGKNFTIMQQWSVDENYIPTLQIHLNSGRNFSRAFPSDSNAVIINEAAAKLFSAGSPLNKKLYLIENLSPVKLLSYTVIGVISNFNFNSLHQQVTPIVLKFYPDNGSIAIRINTADLSGLLSKIKEKWKTIAPSEPFSYSFLDDEFNNQYSAEQHTGTISLIFSALAILIACLGLFGLAEFSAEQRTKEIGIRKVLGASIPGIIGMISKEFLILTFTANLLAWPIAWYFMNNWLQNFAYRTNITWWIFFLAGGIALLIALATISFQAIKAATANPVESLRYE